MMRLQSLLLSLMVISCTVQTTESQENKTQLGLSAGSCIQKDSTNNSTLCLERSNPTEFDSVMCQAAQGTWSPKLCDASQYGRICKQETIETIDDGEPHTVLYTYYFKKDSQFSCAGQEVKNVEASPDAPRADADPIEDTPSTLQGQTLYAEKGCANCHESVESSLLRGYSAESIIRAYDAPQHINLKWPSAEEALAIRDALALSSAELIALGRGRYTDWCQGCHQVIEQSTIKDQTFAGITGARSLSVHSPVVWPNEKFTRALEAALKVP